MLEHLNREVFTSGEHIFKEGDVGDCAYIIEEGSVQIYVHDGQRELVVGAIGKGELFGEVALVDHQPRTASVRALEDTVLVTVHRKLMDGLLEQTNPIVRHLLLVILERFRVARHKELHPTVTRRSGEPEELSATTVQRDSIRGEATQKLTLARDITRALAKGEFELYYQPICELTTGRVAGYEALIRWNHPKDGLISPLDFIWLAEQTGQIREIGLWTLERACMDWPELRGRTDYHAPFVSVNLSASQLTGVGLIDDVKTIMALHGMPPTELKLELTETVIINNPDVALELLGQLGALGSTLALDDFGTGHSGLESLQRYPIGTIKIDIAFIRRLTESLQSLAIVRSSINLAHSLGMNVVAEGVETEEIWSSLLELGCDFGQGWHFGRPAELRGGGK